MLSGIVRSPEPVTQYCWLAIGPVTTAIALGAIVGLGANRHRAGFAKDALVSTGALARHDQPGGTDIVTVIGARSRGSSKQAKICDAWRGKHMLYT